MPKVENVVTDEEYCSARAKRKETMKSQEEYIGQKEPSKPTSFWRF